MNQRKLNPAVAAISASIALMFAAPGVAVASHDDSQVTSGVVVASHGESHGDPRFNRPLPPRCYPEYMTTRGDCLVLL